jgi:hypothetical protein
MSAAEEPKCCECGAVIVEPEDFIAAVGRASDMPEEYWLCDQCACAYAGICDACKGPCRGLAWPKNCTHIWPRWPV